MNGDNNASRIPKLIVELRNIIVEIYGIREQQFGELLSIKFTETYKYDYSIDAEGKTPPDRMLYTVKWFHADAGLDGLLDLAVAVSEGKPRRNDIKSLIEKIHTLIGRVVPPPTPGSPLLPQDLAATVNKLEQQVTTMAEFAREFRQSLRAKNYRTVDLPGRYHLSELDGERSAAILALEAYPDPAYLRWLAERVTVELPHAGFLASQALIAAALRSSRTDLPRLLKVVKLAKDRLDRLDKSLDAEQGIMVYNISARKDKLTDAENLIEMRTTPPPDRMKPDDLDAYLKALLEIFDESAFEKLFTDRLRMPLNYLVRVTDPLELIVVSVIIKGRDTELGPNLIRAVHAEKPDNATFLAIYKKYAPAPVHV